MAPRDMSNKVEENLKLVEDNLKLVASRSRSRSVVSIFRVPSILITDTEKKEAYVPKRVSLGPYHQKLGENHVRTPMDDLKSRALYRMTRRFNDDDGNLMALFHSAWQQMENLQSQVRHSYEENINCHDDALALMLIHDGCFILEILRTLSGDASLDDDNRDYYEPLFEEKKIRFTGMDILYDILKLENQVPFIVLRKLVLLDSDIPVERKLLQLELNSTDIQLERKLLQLEQKHLKKLCSEFLLVFYPFDCKKEDIEQWSWPQPDEVHHLLGLLHRFIISLSPQNGDHPNNSHNGDYGRLPDKDEERADNGDENDNAKGNIASNVHRAIDLGNAGIKFRACNIGIAGIHYDELDATICLPTITIGDSTETLFRNLIAFEMCKPSEFNYVSRYVCLMDHLIDSEEDAALLRKRGIIRNHIGSDGEVAKLFNGLCKGVTVNLQGAFDQLPQKVHKQYNNKFRVQLAELVKEYFSSPWKILGLLGGIALLLLSTLQTIFAILTLYK